ncbi:hypothetical protein R83H12_00651 [Fibrobacteria bacterium R8-3-H12]
MYFGTKKVLKISGAKMASISKAKINGNEYHQLTDKSAGRNLRYSVKLDKHTAKQWLSAHNAIMQALPPEQRKSIGAGQIRQLAGEWLASPKSVKAKAAESGLVVKAGAAIEKSIETVFAEYLANFCKAGINSQTAIAKAQRQCKHLLEFLKGERVRLYSELRIEHISSYPDWRVNRRFDGRAGAASADTVNKELNRLGAVIKHGVKHCGWQERYLLDGVRVKATPQNTKAIKPFELAEAKAILAWLGDYSKSVDSWHLHDMALLALCSGLEAKALNLLKPDWFKLDLGILRVYDKLVSGVIDAKTQNRARDIPLTPTMRKLFERGYIFKRTTRTHRKSSKGGTAFAAWAESILRKAERETGIDGINLHRFRHTCATARLSAGWQLVRVSRMLGHSSVNTTASHYAEYDLSASPAGFEGMLAVYADFVRWLDEGYFA